MKPYLALACAALAATAAWGQNAPAAKTAAPTDIQGVRVSPAPSTLPPNSMPIVPPSASAPFNKPSGIVVPDYATPPGAMPKVIINYWDVVRDMMSRVQKAPPRPARAAGRPGELRPDYPFEEFRNLRGADLIRAAHEGALAGRRQKAGRPAAEIDRQVWENAALALEYFPLVVRDDKDIQSLARIIENREEDLELRRFVLASLAPDQKNPSLLSMFLNDAYARYPGEFNRVLEAASGHPMEIPVFQVEGMRVFHARLMKRYNAAFAADAKIAALEKQTGQPVASALLVGEKPPALEKATREKLGGLGRVIADFGGLIAAHIDPNSASDAAVKTETRRILERIASEVLLPDREVILRYLDPSRPAPPAEEGMPILPVMPDTGNDDILMPMLPGAETGLPIAPQVSQGDQPPPTPVPLPSGL
jgi:hypothetical protein